MKRVPDPTSGRCLRPDQQPRPPDRASRRLAGPARRGHVSPMLTTRTVSPGVKQGSRRMS
jgi:hypothetical protein